MRYVYILLVTVMVGAVIVSQPTSAKEIDESCKSVEIVVARGSGQKVKNQNGGNEEKTDMIYLSDQLSKILNDSNVSHHSYELGAESYGGYSYPAVSLDNWLVPIGAKISGGKGYAYGRSVDSGVGELRSYVVERSNKCPNSRFILAGYSQGAQVVGQSLSRLNNKILSKIDYVALFGDPKLYLPEGKNKFPSQPDACKPGATNSPWRRGTAGCRTYEGALGSRTPYLPDGGIHLRTGSWCNRGDGICGASFILSLSGHGTYKDVSIDDAAREAARALRFGNTIIDRPEADSPRNARDILVVVDASRLPKGDYKTYIKKQLESKKLIRENNRIAIITFGENGENKFRLVTGLTGDKMQLYNAIDSIPEYNGYYGVVWGFDYFEQISKMGQKLQWRPFSKRLTLILDYQTMQRYCIDALSVCSPLPYYETIDSIGGAGKSTMRSKVKAKNEANEQQYQIDEDFGQLDDIMEDSAYQP